MICQKDITSLKTDIDEKIGQKIIVKGSLGRSKTFEKEATIEKAYPNLFVIKFEENNRKYIGKVEKVLIEGHSKNNDKTLTARTDSNKVVIIEADDSMIGKVVDVKIVSEHKWYLKGVIV